MLKVLRNTQSAELYLFLLEYTLTLPPMGVLGWDKILILDDETFVG